MLQCAPMTVPVVVPRAEHAISRKQIDPDALKVLYRLHQNNYARISSAAACATCCLAAVRRTSTSAPRAHPYQVKRLFRNCWIIGRRFRLAHVRFGMKTIEVATFRRQVDGGGAGRAATSPAKASPSDEPSVDGGPISCCIATTRSARRKRMRSAATSPSTRSSTTSADFRSSTTPAACEDLEARVIRCIGDPTERFQEDPVRMLRAVAMAARLDFTHRSADR